MDKSSGHFNIDPFSNEAFTEYLCLDSSQNGDSQRQNEYLVANEKLNLFLAFLLSLETLFHLNKQIRHSEIQRPIQ